MAFFLATLRLKTLTSDRCCAFLSPKRPTLYSVSKEPVKHHVFVVPPRQKREPERRGALEIYRDGLPEAPAQGAAKGAEESPPRRQIFCDASLNKKGSALRRALALRACRALRLESPLKRTALWKFSSLSNSRVPRQLFEQWQRPRISPRGRAGTIRARAWLLRCSTPQAQIIQGQRDICFPKTSRFNPIK